MQKQSNPMLEQPVNKMLLKMAAPISLGMLSTFLFQIVDTYFVGQLGSAELAALAFSSTAYLLFLSVFMGLSVGVSAVVAKTMGEGGPDRARGLTMASLALVLILSVALGLGARALIGIFAVSMSITPFIAQNFGAGAHDRIDDAVIFAGKASIYIGGILLVVLALLGPAIARIFSDDPEVIRFVSFYFKFVAVSYGFQGILNVTVAILNGLQMPGTALRLMAIRTFVIVFPLLLIGAQLGLWWILAALTLGNVIAAIYAGRLMRAITRKYDRPIAGSDPFKDIIGDIRSLTKSS